MEPDTLSSRIWCTLGPVEITATMIESVVASAIVIAMAVVVRSGLQGPLSRWQVAAEFIVEHLEDVMRDMSGRDPRPFTALVVTLAVFIAVANLLGLLPGLRAPTADISTTAALALVVFLAVPFYGIRTRGLRGYLKHYLEPSPLLLPLEIITEFRVAETMLALSVHGHAVIVGRGATVVLPAATTLRVRLLAPLEARIRGLCEKRGLTQSTARHEIQTVDRDRAAFVRQHFGGDVTNLHTYDLVVNTARFSTEQAAEIIAASLHQLEDREEKP